MIRIGFYVIFQFLWQKLSSLIRSDPYTTFYNHFVTECLGPALQGEGEGLLTAIISGNLMSEQIQAQIESGQVTVLHTLSYILIHS